MSRSTSAGMHRIPTWKAGEIATVRAQFSILAPGEDGTSLAYFDSASTSQRPSCVLEAMDEFYNSANANVHRGLYGLAVAATERYERARRDLAEFLGVNDPQELVFVRGVTEAVNLIAQSFVRPRVGPDDEILVTLLEHHSNFVPWQMVAEQTGATLRIAGVTEAGDLDLEDFRSKLSSRTRFVSVTAVSNAIGTVTPLNEIIGMAHKQGAKVFVDGAQAAAHVPVDVTELGADFYAISGHKMYGPTGIGVLWGSPELLAEMPPYQGGGDMIREVRVDGVDYAAPPQRFEAGTPNIAGAIGLGRAARFVREFDPADLRAHEERLLEMMIEGLDARDGVRIVGRPTNRASVVSFVLDGVHAQDAATILDKDGLCVRVGHHCAQPLLHRLGETATLRASIAVFNQVEEVERLLASINKVQRIFRV
jgi:cysteine desulfurase / selenocysteine lyase